jgi:hypothetical protein
MRFGRIIKKRIRAAGKTGEAGKGTNLDGDVNAIFSVNVGEGPSRTRAASKQRIVQRSAKKTRRDASPKGNEDG